MRLSARNQLAGTVTGTTEGPATTTVALDVGEPAPSPQSPRKPPASSASPRAPRVVVIIKASDVILAVAD